MYVVRFLFFDTTEIISMLQHAAIVKIAAALLTIMQFSKAAVHRAQLD